VAVVLNSLSGDFIPASLRCLAPRGWFLELGKREIWSPEQVRSERPDVRYRAFDLGEEAHADHGLLRPMLDELTEALADGTLRPLPVRTYEMADAPAAFRWMAQARHIGKLVLRAPRRAGAAGEDLIRPDATYWITGGAGALGLRTARWMVESGARHVVLTGRTPPNAEGDEVLAQCRAQGARVEFRIADAADVAAMTSVQDEISAAFPPLRGVVHAAGALDDGMLVHQTWDRWRSVLHGKACGARVLDALSRDAALDFFILYSSAGPLLGPVGQGSYAAANAELDALAWARRSRGLPALSVSWGQWAEAGMAVRLRAAGRDVWSERGLGWLDPEAAFGHLERLLHDDAVHAVVLPIRWDRFLSQLPDGMDRSFFAAVAPTGGPPDTAGPVSHPLASAATVVDSWRAAPASERRRLVIGHVAGLTRQVLDIEPDVEIEERVALKEAGLDSLMAVELRNVLTRSLGRSLPATLLFDHPSLDALAAYLLQQFDLVPSPTGTAWPMAVDDDGEDLSALTDEEAEALLLAELGEPEGAA
jgi:NAD(P)-dependent dehydrogenase (short-subunit alcohol dehydrogenase family)/acyl carrier protein